jgi:hypothetical protein
MTLSVSVIQFTSRAHLVRCLAALEAQQGGVSEVIVPHDDTLHDVAALREEFPDIRFIHLAGRRPPAELRAAATLAAGGEIMAFLEDHCVPAPDWALRLLHAHAQAHAHTHAHAHTALPGAIGAVGAGGAVGAIGSLGAGDAVGVVGAVGGAVGVVGAVGDAVGVVGAVGGAVEKGFPAGERGDTALNWAIYMADYSRYMNPQPAGPSASLTDCNVSYRRVELESIRGAWEAAFHENIVNGLLAERGRTLWLAPDAVVHEQRTLTVATAVRDRFAFGRLFASTRVTDAPLGRRLVYAAGALAMPPVLVARVAANLFGRSRHRLQFFRALPALVLVTSTWMLGECVGYLTGTAAHALPAAAAPAAVAAGTEGSAP